MEYSAKKRNCSIEYATARDALRIQDYMNTSFHFKYISGGRNILYHTAKQEWTTVRIMGICEQTGSDRTPITHF